MAVTPVRRSLKRQRRSASAARITSLAVVAGPKPDPMGTWGVAIQRARPESAAVTGHPPPSARYSVTAAVAC